MVSPLHSNVIINMYISIIWLFLSTIHFPLPGINSSRSSWLPLSPLKFIINYILSNVNINYSYLFSVILFSIFLFYEKIIMTYFHDFFFLSMLSFLPLCFGPISRNSVTFVRRFWLIFMRNVALEWNGKKGLGGCEWGKAFNGNLQI